MYDGLRKSLAVLSVILLLSAVHCVAACTASGEQIAARKDSTTVPPCHRHHAPVHGTENSVPCQDHPGLLAYSVHPPAAPLPLPVSLVATPYEPLVTRPSADESGSGVFAHIPPLPRPDAQSYVILRI